MEKKESGVLCLGGRFAAKYYGGREKEKQRRKQRLMYIIYALCVFTSNFAITVMTKTINSSYGWALFGNELYELCNVGSLYLGIKNLPFWKMITLQK